MRHCVGTGQLSGFGGVQTADIYEAAEMVFGGTLRQERVYLHGLKNYNLTDGLVASGFLTTYNSHLDFVGRRVDIYPDSQPQFEGYTSLNARLKSDGGSSRIMAKVTLDGMSLNMLVDTGASATLIYPQTVRRLKLWDKYADYKASRAKGMSGKTTDTRTVTVPNLDLGGHLLEKVDISLTDPDAIAGELIDGLLGIDVIRQFNWAFLGHSDIRIAPNSYFNMPWIRQSWPVFNGLAPTQP